MSDKPSVVLVHGGFVDGSGWHGVYDLLTADGYQVSIVQNPTLSLEGDAAATRMILDRQDRPSILVGTLLRRGSHQRGRYARACRRARLHMRLRARCR